MPLLTIQHPKATATKFSTAWNLVKDLPSWNTQRPGRKYSVTEDGGKLYYYCIIPLVWWWRLNETYERLLWAHVGLMKQLLLLSLSGFGSVKLLYLLLLFLPQARRPHQLLLQSLRQTPASGGGNILGPPVRRRAGKQDHRQQCQWDTSAPAGVDERKKPITLPWTNHLSAPTRNILTLPSWIGTLFLPLLTHVYIDVWSPNSHTQYDLSKKAHYFVDCTLADTSTSI